MRRRAVLAVAALTLLAGGCGIPDNTEVRPLRPGPSTGVTAGGDTPLSRATREEATDPGQLVKNYLAAAAGDIEGAVDRAKEFLSPSAGPTFKPQADVIKVVRLTEEPLVNPTSSQVRLQVHEVGTLRQKGILDPSAESRTITYQFEVGTVPNRTGLFITKVPQLLLLSDEALDTFFTPHSIYFWNQDRSGLIPDVRYLAQSVPREQRPNQILDWLTSGPAPWLSTVAEALPDGTKPIGNVPAVTNETLQISLTGQALPQDDAVGALDRLQKQLRWSLRTYLPATVEITVEQAADQKFTGTDYLAAYAGYRPIAEPERFAIFNGQIRRLRGSYHEGEPVPAIRPEDNKGVRSAALSSAGGRTYVALVVADSAGKQTLRVGAAGEGEQAALRRVALAGPFGRPVWAKSATGAPGGTPGLITANGKLYSFSPDGKTVREVQWQGGQPGRVTAVAVAPDAARVAIIADGKLYVAALARSDDGMSLSSPHVIRTEMRSLTAVDWSSERLLAVAGRRADLDRTAVMDVSLDGAVQSNRLDDLGENPVTYLTAMPVSPTKGDTATGVISYMIAGAAFDDEDRGPLGPQDLVPPVSDPPAGVRPGSPFFLS